MSDSYDFAHDDKAILAKLTCPRCHELWAECPCGKACPVCGGGRAQEKPCDCKPLFTEADVDEWEKNTDKLLDNDTEGE